MSERRPETSDDVLIMCNVFDLHIHRLISIDDLQLQGAADVADLDLHPPKWPRFTHLNVFAATFHKVDVHQRDMGVALDVGDVHIEIPT